MSDVENLGTQLLTFYCPLTSYVSPEFGALREFSRDWAEQFDIGEGDPRRTAVFAELGAAFTAHLIPHATGETAKAFVRYNTWGWLPNDRVESDLPLGDIIVGLGRWEHILRSPDAWHDSAAPADRALRDAVLALREALAPVQYERFIAGQSQWLYSMTTEAVLVQWGTPLNVNDYLALRFSSVGGYSAIGFMDGATHSEISAQQWARPEVRALTEAAGHITALDNDRYSYFKERRMASRKHNLFAALRYEHPDWSLERAVTEAVAIRDRIMTLYLRLRERLLRDADEDMRRYLAGWDHMITGNITLPTLTARYRSAETANGVTIVDKPSDPSTEPLPIPTIAWWWDQLG
ncbi:hypothetical protein [Streptomyces sp. NPDC058295]|uniref:terpene synthase family protein n=1 Tax=Streptomyces sp. NPDC058295 TaxID=3346431 RepID=UPI0036E69DB7